MFNIANRIIRTEGDNDVKKRRLKTKSKNQDHVIFKDWTPNDNY